MHGNVAAHAFERHQHRHIEKRAPGFARKYVILPACHLAAVAQDGQSLL